MHSTIFQGRNRGSEEHLRGQRVSLSRITFDDLKLPSGWIDENPMLPQKIAEEIAIARPGGFVVKTKEALIATVAGLADFVRVTMEGGEYAKLETLPESELQKNLRQFLRGQGLAVAEGAEVGGGETDLISQGQVVIENKDAGSTNSPMSEAKAYPFQARRYSIAVCKTAFCTVVAYKPRSETGVLQQSACIEVRGVPDVPGDCVEIRLVVPYGYDTPSKAKKPDATGA